MSHADVKLCGYGRRYRLIKRGGGTAIMPRWFKVTIAAVLPLAAGALTWLICVARGLDLDATGIIVGLVVLLPGTPLAIWAGQPDPTTGAANTDLAQEHPPRPVPGVIGDIPREPKAFQPRPELLKRVVDIYSVDHAAAVCALAGARGVGKTHVAAAYARHCLDQGIPVSWLHAETIEQLHSSLDLMATELGLRSETDDATAVTYKVKAWMQERREPYLVVFDNATDADTLAPLLPSHGRTRVLITTNDHTFERLAALVPVERFTAQEALVYLTERIGPGDAAELLAEELDRLPLALSIAAAALVGPPPLTYEAYLVRLRATSIEVALARPRGEPYPRGVAQAIMLSVGETTPAAARLLGELSVLSSAGVGLDMLGPSIDEALTELASRSLVTFSSDSSTTFAHRLVRRVIRDRAERDGTLATLIGEAARRLKVLVEDIADEDTWRKLPIIMAVSEQASALWGCIEQFPDRNHALAELLLDVRQAVASHLVYLNDGVRAVPIAEAVVAGREKLLGADHPDTLEALHTLAHAHEYTDHPTKAIELYQRAAAERACVLGDDHADTLRSRAGLAAAHTMAGRAVEAMELLEQVAADQERVLNSDHPIRLATRFFQAYAHVEAGLPREAVDLFEGLVADQERLLGIDHPETLVIRGRLAWAYVAAMRADEAVQLYGQVLSDQERVLGADHPDTLITQHGLARAYEMAGRAAEALTQFEQVAERFERVLGPGQTWTRDALEGAERVRQIRNSKDRT
jgi:tetratricopeptide (TPR) repeat protein